MRQRQEFPMQLTMLAIAGLLCVETVLATGMVPSDWRLKDRCLSVQKEIEAGRGTATTTTSSSSSTPVLTPGTANGPWHQPPQLPPEPHGDIRPNAFIAACLARASYNTTAHIAAISGATATAPTYRVATPSLTITNPSLPPEFSQRQIRDLDGLYGDALLSHTDLALLAGGGGGAHDTPATTPEESQGFAIKESYKGGARPTYYVVFKGTSSAADLAEDLTLLLGPWPVEWVRGYPAASITAVGEMLAGTAVQASPEGISAAFRVHQGFLKKYTRVRASLLPLVRRYVSEGANVEIVGHGAGGAVASMAFIDLHLSGILGSPPADVQSAAATPQHSTAPGATAAAAAASPFSPQADALRSLEGFYNSATPIYGLTTFGACAFSSATFDGAFRALASARSRYVMVTSNYVQDPVSRFPSAYLHYSQGIGAVYLCSDQVAYSGVADLLLIHAIETYALHVLQRLLVRNSGLLGGSNVVTPGGSSGSQAGGIATSVQLAAAQHARMASPFALGLQGVAGGVEVQAQTRAAVHPEVSAVDTLVTWAGYLLMWVVACYVAAALFRAYSRARGGHAYTSF